MAEDFDVEAMLEAPFNERTKDDESSRSSSPSRERRRRSRSRGEEDIESSSSRRKKSSHRKRSRSKERRSRKSRSRSRERRKRSRSRDRKRKSRSRSKDRKERDRRRRHSSRSRSKSREARRRRRDERSRDRSRSRDRISRDRSRSPRRESSIEERDQRTVLCVQLAAAVRQKDLEEFFSSVGKVREVRLILDNKTRKHKGIAYIEFYEVSSVPLALALNGQRLCGRPVMIQPSMAERNRAAPMNAASAAAAAIQRHTGPMRLYVGSLHFNITEDMLRGIFEPFGRIDKIELMRDPENHRSKGFGFITFCDAEDAKKALDQLNGFELAGRPMKVNHVTERADGTYGSSLFDSEESDRSGIELGSTGRLHLMAKLAEGTGIQLPQAAVHALQLMGGSSHQRGGSHGGSHVAVPNSVIPHAQTPVAVATQCFLLTNMFDVNAIRTQDPYIVMQEAEEIKNDVLDECRKHGGAVHIAVDTKSSGNVYVKCPNAITAAACVSALHGRYFSGRVVTAAFVPLVSYHALFPEATRTSSLL